MKQRVSGMALATGVLILSRARWRIADLGGDLLGLAAGDTITLDNDAAGVGWFFDPTPDLDEEFAELLASDVKQAQAGSAASGDMDLLTVILHELGHLLQRDHDHDNVSDLMYYKLARGLRKLPTQ